MTDPVTTMLAAQTQFGDDDMKKEVEAYITAIARKVAQEEIIHMLNNPDSLRRIIVNHNHDFETGVARAMKNFLNNPRNIY